MNFQRTRIRLDPFAYRGTGMYFLTMCCNKRHAAFTRVSVGVWLVRLLTRCASYHAYAVHAYCVMPDHVHFLTEGTRETCHLAEFVSEFKQRTGYLYHKKLGICLWQPRYYDHVLRRSEDIENVAWYIWTNPIRKGLCSSPQEYALSGSLTSDWKKRCAPAKMWSPPWKDSSKRERGLLAPPTV
jgi:putative transposase